MVSQQQNVCSRAQGDRETGGERPQEEVQVSYNNYYCGRRLLEWKEREGRVVDGAELKWSGRARK